MGVSEGIFANGAVTGAFAYMFAPKPSEDEADFGRLEGDAPREHVLANAADLEGEPVMGRGECVDLLKGAMGAPPASTWTQGRPIAPGADIAPGTAIATFVNGQYPNNPTGQQAAIYLGQDASGIKVVEQYRSLDTIQIRTIRWNVQSGTSLSNNGRAFSTVKW